MSKQPPVDDLIGRVFEDRYKIISPLGEGGMGAVYKGEHVVIGRQVAIKVLHARLGNSQDFASRFAREAVAAGRLAHPNCVPVTDSGQLDDGTAYMVMELVKGSNLGDLLEVEAPLQPIRALRIIRHVLRGLGHAHKVGIVHRDIKPDNVMLAEREDDPDFARVLDFGIAKLRDDENKQTENLTQAGMAVGTPSYLSPEQALGEDVDHRSDLYSASVLLFEMLTGRPPFTAENPLGILTKHASAAIPHLSDVLPELVSLTDLDAITQHGLAKSRHDRYQSAESFVQAIDKALMNFGAVISPAPPDAMPPAQDTRAGSIGDDTANFPPTKVAAVASPAQRNKIVLALAFGTLLLSLAVYSLRTGGNSTSTTDTLLALHLKQLNTGKTCVERLKAVKALHSLGDPRAVPDLKRSRKKMRGGTLGFRKKNVNQCLRKAAQKAIKALEP